MSILFPRAFAYAAPFAVVAVIAGSIRFHKVMAIETKAKEYKHISELFMSDIVRKRLGLPFP